MKLENQVCSKELAIKLHKLHVTTPSLFYWEWTGATTIERWENGEPDYCEDNICAYTVAELGEMLPMRYLAGHKIEFDEDNSKIVRCWNVSTQKVSYEARANTEADARAKMLIYLMENKLITLPTI